jgi:hypothetical protein
MSNLCCLIHPAARCPACGFGLCQDCGSKADAGNHKCTLPLKKGYVWEISGDCIKQGVGREWAFGSMHGVNMKGWVPGPTTMPARYMKAISVMGPLRRKWFHDSAQVSNLSTNKSKYIRHTKKGYVLTAKGKKYVQTHDIPFDRKKYEKEYTYFGRYKKNK